MSNPIETLDSSQPLLDAAVATTLPAVHPLADTQDANELAPIAANAAAFPIAHWDRYTFVRMLGQGGMGTVYEARDHRLDRNVALKFIRGGDPALQLRLAREARAQARIEHENVCKVFEVGEVEGKAYIAMQFVHGEPLDKAAAQLSLDEKVIVMRDVARALHAAHTLGILHRDIKPSNILVEVTDDGRRRPIVMDFGLARDEGERHGMTETGAILGTPAYMSPEQARGGRDVDRRSDVYSLGATLYELVCGDAPFAGDTPMNIVLAVLHDEPIPLRTRVPSVPTDLATIAAKCLHKDPAQRYESARALAEDLDRYLRGEPILGRRESTVRRLRRWAGKHRAIVATTLVALVVVGVAAGIAVQGRMQAAREKAELQAQAEVERNLEQDIKEMEWLLRTAHMLPLHDVTRERATVKERMKRMEERAGAGGRVGALVDYAVGRGHLALGEDEEAYQRLMRAQKNGIDSPELHYALGLVLGKRYDRALLQARQEKGSGRDKKEIEKEFLLPTLAAMEKSRHARLESPSYLDALLSYYKKNYEEALTQAQKALTETPWLYEAIELQAGIHMTRGIEQGVQGEIDLATKDFAESSRLFDAAAEIGRSDARLYEGSAEALRYALKIAPRDGRIEALKRESLARCESAAAIEPSRSTPYLVMADVYGTLLSLHSTRKDPRPTIQAKIAALEKAMAIGGTNHTRCHDLALAYGTLAEDLMLHGLDAENAAQMAVTMGRCAAGAEKEAETFDFVGRADIATVGHDNVLLAPLESYRWLGLWYVNRGKNPGPSLLPAFELIANELRSNPRNVVAHRYQGVFQLLIAKFQRTSGQDAHAAIALARQQFEEAQRLAPSIVTQMYFTELLLLHAEDAFARAEDPRADLDNAAEKIEACIEAVPSDSECRVAEAQHALLTARDAAAKGGDERDLLELALQQASDVANVANSEDRGWDYQHALRAYEVVTEATLRLVALARPDERRKRIATARDACEKGLAINPNHPRLLLTCGGLGVVEARALAGQTRTETAKKARASLEKAASLNPLLRRDVDPWVAEAKRLGAGGE